ncbi:MAG: hypothetical protein GTN82_12490, partial [Candidatus Aminicenantes bacterium]|nr:hypothetical protein [Candidatus Aminicenantes bacterium]
MNVKNLIGWGRRPLSEKPQRYRESIWGLFILFIILVFSLCHYNCASREALEVLVYPPEYFISGTDTSLRVIVLDHKTGQPTPDAQVTIR